MPTNRSAERKRAHGFGNSFPSGSIPKRAVFSSNPTCQSNTELHLLFSIVYHHCTLGAGPDVQGIIVEQVTNKELRSDMASSEYPFFRRRIFWSIGRRMSRRGTNTLPLIVLTREIARKYNQLFGEFFSRAGCVADDPFRPASGLGQPKDEARVTETPSISKTMKGPPGIKWEP
jgi:hypothetical protein